MGIVFDRRKSHSFACADDDDDVFVCMLVSAFHLIWSSSFLFPLWLRNTVFAHDVHEWLQVHRQREFIIYSTSDGLEQVAANLSI